MICEPFTWCEEELQKIEQKIIVYIYNVLSFLGKGISNLKFQQDI